MVPSHHSHLFLSPLSTLRFILSRFVRISKESSSKTSLLFSIRKRHHSQNEMVRMLIYNTFYGVTVFGVTGVTGITIRGIHHLHACESVEVVAKQLDGSRRGASLNIGNATGGLRHMLSTTQSSSHRGQIPKSTFAFKIGLTTPLSMRSLSVGFDISSNSFIIFLSAAILLVVPA